MLSSWWFFFSGLAFVCGAIWLLVSAWVGYRILSEALPLLSETRNQIQDLGDLAANTVGRASDTMDIVELRVSETMGQATQAGVSATKQVLGVGSALAALYMVSRAVRVLRGEASSNRRRGRGRRRNRK